MLMRSVDPQHNDQRPRGSYQMFHVKYFGTIDGAKILLASYIRQLETGKNARKTGAIARKSVIHPRLRGTAGQCAGASPQLFGLAKARPKRQSQSRNLVNGRMPDQWEENMPLNVRDFGAMGDGVTDDTAAIQEALDTLMAVPRGGTLY